MFEKAIVHRLKEFFEKFNLLSENQYGFRNNKTTEKAIKNFTSSTSSVTFKFSFESPTSNYSTTIFGPGPGFPDLSPSPPASSQQRPSQPFPPLPSPDKFNSLPTHIPSAPSNKPSTSLTSSRPRPLPSSHPRPLGSPPPPPQSLPSLPINIPLTPLTAYPVKSSSSFPLTGGGCPVFNKLLKEGQKEAFGGEECGVLTCRKYGGRYHLEELKCNVVVYNPNYTCVVTSDLKKPFPQCCPQYWCDD
ncbi:hypothetical protein SK128_012581 [Halocaridina rubra]|uniref:Single domain-containing protein n=1 Tax=Halocaridina rubra TaxID=373956 RepID=A0AAN9A486_HALRR